MTIHLFNIPTVSNQFKFKILNNMDYENRPFPTCVQEPHNNVIIIYYFQMCIMKKKIYLYQKKYIVLIKKHNYFVIRLKLRKNDSTKM